jgi:hypothetical protein
MKNRIRKLTICVTSPGRFMPIASIDLPQNEVGDKTPTPHPRLQKTPESIPGAVQVYCYATKMMMIATTNA